MRGSRGHPQRLYSATARSCLAYQRREDRPMTDIVVESVGAARSYERGNRMIEALAPATCRIRAGDRIDPAGPSRSGKNALLHLMAGLDEPSAGEIRWPMLRGADT